MTEQDKQHLRNLARLQADIEALYKATGEKLVRLGARADEPEADKAFSFADHPTLARQAEQIMAQLGERVCATVENAMEVAWELSNEKNDKLVDEALGEAVKHISEEQRKAFYDHGEQALAMFQKRKEAGLKLSDRVWNYTQTYRTEVEAALDLGLREHKTAEELSRDVRQYLKYPNKLFRRVRNQDGKLVLSKNAKAFHPGQGVYRSSYMNARRLAATETNIAYRTATTSTNSSITLTAGVMYVMMFINSTCQVRALSNL